MAAKRTMPPARGGSKKRAQPVLPPKRAGSQLPDWTKKRGTTAKVAARRKAGQ